MKKNFKNSCQIVVLLGMLILLISCTIYSSQKYGPEQALGMVTPGKSTISEVIKGYGAPDAIYKSGEQEIYIFKSRTGKCFLCIYSKVEMTDIVIIAKNGIVQEIYSTPKGEGMTIIGYGMSPTISIGNAH